MRKLIIGVEPAKPGQRSIKSQGKLNEDQLRTVIDLAKALAPSTNITPDGPHPVATTPVEAPVTSVPTPIPQPTIFETMPTTSSERSASSIENPNLPSSAPRSNPSTVASSTPFDSRGPHFSHEHGPRQVSVAGSIPIASTSKAIDETIPKEFPVVISEIAGTPEKRARTEDPGSEKPSDEISIHAGVMWLEGRSKRRIIEKTGLSEMCRDRLVGDVETVNSEEEEGRQSVPERAQVAFDAEREQGLEAENSHIINEAGNDLESLSSTATGQPSELASPMTNGRSLGLKSPDEVLVNATRLLYQGVRKIEIYEMTGITESTLVYIMSNRNKNGGQKTAHVAARHLRLVRLAQAQSEASGSDRQVIASEDAIAAPDSVQGSVKSRDHTPETSTSSGIDVQEPPQDLAEPDWHSSCSHKHSNGTLAQALVMRWSGHSDQTILERIGVAKRVVQRLLSDETDSGNPKSSTSKQSRDQIIAFAKAKLVESQRTSIGPVSSPSITRSTSSPLTATAPVTTTTPEESRVRRQKRSRSCRKPQRKSSGRSVVSDQILIMGLARHFQGESLDVVSASLSHDARNFRRVLRVENDHGGPRGPVAMARRDRILQAARKLAFGTSDSTQEAPPIASTSGSRPDVPLTQSTLSSRNRTEMRSELDESSDLSGPSEVSGDEGDESRSFSNDPAYEDLLTEISPDDWGKLDEANSTSKIDKGKARMDKPGPELVSRSRSSRKAQRKSSGRSVVSDQILVMGLARHFQGESMDAVSASLSHDARAFQRILRVENDHGGPRGPVAMARRDRILQAARKLAFGGSDSTQDPPPIASTSGSRPDVPLTQSTLSSRNRTEMRSELDESSDLSGPSEVSGDEGDESRSFSDDPAYEDLLTEISPDDGGKLDEGNSTSKLDKGKRRMEKPEPELVSRSLTQVSRLPQFMEDVASTSPDLASSPPSEYMSCDEEEASTVASSPAVDPPSKLVTKEEDDVNWQTKIPSHHLHIMKVPPAFCAERAFGQFKPFGFF